MLSEVTGVNLFDSGSIFLRFFFIHLHDGEVENILYFLSLSFYCIINWCKDF